MAFGGSFADPEDLVRRDAARLFRLALEQAPAGTARHGAGESAITFETITHRRADPAEPHRLSDPRADRRARRRAVPGPVLRHRRARLQRRDPGPGSAGPRPTRRCWKTWSSATTSPPSPP